MNGDDDERPLDRPEAEPEQPSAVDARAHGRIRAGKKLKARESEKFWRDIFESELGRREMWGLLQSAHAFEERFACGPNGFPQVEATWLHAGEQALGQRLYQTWLVRFPELVALMHSENDVRFQKPKGK